MDGLRACFLVGVTLLLLLRASPALACSCGGRLSITEALADADSVFEGRVINTWPISIRQGGINGLALRYTFRVNFKWKGALGSTVDLAGSPAPGSCSFPFRRGESYVVFAYSSRDMPYPSSSICTRTIATMSAERLLYRELGSGEHVSNDYVAEAESLIHVAGRRLRIAVLGVQVWHQEWWRSLEDSPNGVVLRYCLQVAGLAFLAVALAALLVRRWWVGILMLVLPLLTGGLVALAWSYSFIANSPWYDHLMN